MFLSFYISQAIIIIIIIIQFILKWSVFEQNQYSGFIFKIPAIRKCFFPSNS